MLHLLIWFWLITCRQGKFKLHIRKLSSDGRHEGAAKAAIILECDGREKPVHIEIRGDYIAVLTEWRISKLTNKHLILVDWKEGIILLVSEFWGTKNLG